MKLSKHAFTRFWDVHAWVGVGGALVLHVMFFAGAFALFDAELGAWQEPEAGAAPPTEARPTPRPLGPLVDQVLAGRGLRPTQLQRLDLTLPGAHRRHLEVRWTPVRGEPGETRVDLDSGAQVPESSRLARILFYLHFLYHPALPWLMYVGGVLGAALLLALATGVFIHLKDIVRQFHQFRPARAPRVLWSDLHKVLGVMGLPFQVMYAFTGALIALSSVLLSLLVGPVFGGDREAASAALWGGDGKKAAKRAIRTPAEDRAPLLDLDRLVSAGRRAVPGFEPEYLFISGLVRPAVPPGGGPPARIGPPLAELWGRLPGRLFARGTITLRASDGQVLADAISADSSPGAAVTRWVTGLHYARFGGLPAKVVFALLALATCLTLLSGNWIWLLRRQARAGRPGPQLLARLTLGLGGGVVLATAILFWANRLAPPAWRLAAEPWAFFGAWGLVTGLALVRPASPAGWVGLLGFAGLAFATLPLASVGRAPVHLFNVFQHARPEVLGVELGLLLFGLLLLATAALVARVARGGGPRR